jgi:hypothetical protein
MMLTRRGALHSIAGAAAIASPVVPAAAPRGDQPAIRLRRGMNLWPWFSLTREFPPPRTDYDWPPYQAARAVPHRGDLAALRRAGIDFARIPIDPGPLLAFSGNRQAGLIRDIVRAIDMVLAEGLSVILNLHPNGATHYFNEANLVDGFDAPLFPRFLDLIGVMAAQLSHFDPSRVAFEPLNEPPQDCVSGWPAIQAEMVRVARAAAPRLTFVVTGACGSMISGLEALDPASIEDDNVIYTFHFYEPYVFSHQGAPWMTSEPMYRYLNSVPWPSTTGSKQATLSAVAARMAADRSTPASTKREIVTTIEQALGQYFDARPDRRFIERYFTRVVAWANHHGIDHRRILLGEFGALRTDEHYVAAAAADRARYIRDVRETAEAVEMPWAFWNFFDGMGFTLDDRSRRFDPFITAALGLRASDGR